ncbi:MAG: prepilin-type N-terminal cleavage/methylation domain-containing protein [Acidimicrobiales bacterium]
MHTRRQASRDAGFTLIEILIGIVLVGVLSAVVVVGVGSLTSNGSAASCSASLDATRAALNTSLGTDGRTATTFTPLVSSGALSLPAGVTMQADGHTLSAAGWTLTMSGTTPTLACSTGTPWTPAQLGPDVAMWVDATTVAGSDGSEVASWSSAGTAAVTPAAAASPWTRPTLAASGIGARPSVRFDGIDDVLLFDGSFLVGTDFTVAAVTAREAAFGAGYYIGGAGNGNVGTSFILGRAGDTAVRYSHRNDGFNATVPTFTTVTPTMHVAMSSSVSRNLWIDGTGSGGAGPLPLSTWSNAGIGRDSSGSYRGLVGEIVIVTKALSTSDRQKLEGYLAWKWGTASTLPASHPYRSTPPTV